MLLSIHGEAGDSTVIYRQMSASGDSVTVMLMDNGTKETARLELEMTRTEALAWARGLIAAVEQSIEGSH